MPSIIELEQQIGQGQEELLTRTSPLAFSQILRNALKSRLGARSTELEAGREKSRTALRSARQSLTAGLSPEELKNITPAQQRELVQQRRTGLEASILRSGEETERIEGTTTEQIELGRAMQQDIQDNMLDRLNFLKDDLANQKDKQSEFRTLAFGLAETGVSVTPQIEAMLEGLSEGEKAIWLSQNTAAVEETAAQLALDYAKLASSRSTAPTTEDKLLTAIRADITDPTALLDERRLAASGQEIEDKDSFASREEFISRLETKYGDIEPSDIKWLVYTTYKDKLEITDSDFEAKLAKKLYTDIGLEMPPIVQQALEELGLR